MNRATVLVVGYGNTLRTDDGFGPVVADRLRDCIADASVRVLTRQLLSMELVADLDRVGLCVLVDAATSGVRGELSMREVLPESTDPGTLGHELSAAALIGLGQQLMGYVPRCVLYSIVPESLDLGEGLTSPVAALVDEAVLAIRQRIDRYCADVAAGTTG